MGSTKGKQFERAVHRFVSKLGPTVKVFFDHKVPDRHTGTLRQCDVWVEGTFLRHFPIKYLISCKDRSREVDIKQMGDFGAEIEDVGASSGAIYSRKGFTKTAVAKARKMGIACCQLFEDQAATIPEMIMLWSFATSTQFTISLRGIREQFPDAATWKDLFATTVNDPESGAERPIIDVLDAMYRAGEIESRDKGIADAMLFPPPFVRTLLFPSGRSSITIQARWKRYRAPLSAHLLNGSYSITDGNFLGTQFSPALDVQGPTPGPDWEEIPEGEEVTNANNGRVLMIKCSGNFTTTVIDHFSDRPLPAGA